ncbi:hypothetical protein [Mycobacterium sp. DBP42]|uniref:hypothetical protein n=1 Tax=Mycobacterium sp. DBP42 TaxID=2545267 RepID=UPI00110CFC3E|nr:hypothetical protein [Mycobacterium sp. DBP42]TMS52954.1 hypothetical protein E0T84_13190 [Mycobacterium sp. DBP42]
MNDIAPDTSKDRYGPVGFLAAIVAILVVEYVTWLLLPWIVVAIFFLVPLFLITLGVAAVLTRRPGKLGQVSRGVFIGTLSGPLSLLIFVPVFLLAGTMGAF